MWCACPRGLSSRVRGEYQLFVLDSDSRLQRRKVKLGDSNSSYIEVVSGLEPGDRVTVSDMTDYRNNKSLKLKRLKPYIS